MSGEEAALHLARTFGGIFLLATASPRDANQSQPPFVPSQPQPRKKGRFWKGVGVAALLSVVIGAGLAKFTTIGKDTTGLITNYGGSLWRAKQDPNLLFHSVGTQDGIVNVLLIGPDRNWTIGPVFNPHTGKYAPFYKEDKDHRPRSDTMIIVSFNQNAHSVRMISFSRDSRVRYKDSDGRRHTAKLNTVYTFPDGDTLLPRVINDVLGIRIDRTAVIKLDGFNKLVDRVGGIDVNVEGALYNGKRTRMKYTDKVGRWSVDLEPGMQHLDGAQTQGYVRYRKDNESEPGRIRRQQQVMRALAKQVNNIEPWRVPGLVVEMQKLFNTQMTNDEVVAAALFARSLGSTAKIAPITPFGIYAPDSSGDIILNKPENKKLLAALFGSSFDPQKFLPGRSPSTTHDDFGARNNNNPAAIPVLREAGLLKAEKHHDAGLEAPGLQ